MITQVDDDGPPPLEDMTQVLKQRNLPQAPKPTTIRPVEKQPKKTTHDSLIFESDAIPAPVKPAAKSTSFGGLKSGFFNQAPAQPKKKVDMIQVKAPTKTKQDALRMDEVQEAMKSKMSLLDKQEWLTPSLLEHIQTNPKLQKAFSDPAFAKAASDVAQNPQKAFYKYSQERPDLVEALQEFCKLLGGQLDELATRKEKEQVVESIPDDLPEHEKDLIKRVMQDKQVQDALKDPKIQKLLADIQKNPPLLAKAMVHSDYKDLQPKIQALIRVGLLSIQ